MIRNCMEAIVLDTLEKLKQDYRGMCVCDQCKMDILAISLNKLPPLYTTSDKGEMYAKLNEFQPQFKVNVIHAVTEAVEIVMTHPRHQLENRLK